MESGAGVTQAIVGEEAMKPIGHVERGKFYVQCTFLQDGVPTTRLNDFVNSLQEAEDYFKRQVSEVPPNGGINCIISLVLKNGKRTQIDELFHPASGGTSLEVVEEE
jgi:hypothetical protein